LAGENVETPDSRFRGNDRPATPIVGLAFREYNSALQFGHRVVLPDDLSDLQLLVHAGGAADSPLLPLEAA
jgi:hypothetical protein